jgi:hypothetical protein
VASPLALMAISALFHWVSLVDLIMVLFQVVIAGLQNPLINDQSIKAGTPSLLCLIGGRCCPKASQFDEQTKLQQNQMASTRYSDISQSWSCVVFF